MLDREEISRGLAEGLLYKEIGVRVDRDPSVISREVSRHGGRAGYRATAASARKIRPGTPEAPHGRTVGAAAGGGHRAAACGLVTGVDRGPVAVRLPSRSGCTGVP
ncbi:helix-turn-helix domain-containing protein [Actinoplanes sp. NPDC049599]|uniref:helix-turn-helix domain-containing protein n=1 Tax=Actinoplanes sp. NPDC049599 TaxID=3363903 RepID=UPI003798372F